MKIVIAGGRDFADYERLCVMMDKLKDKYPGEITVVNGLARGADSLGGQWAESRGCEVIRMPANWDRYGKAAGYRRNQEMAIACTHVLAFWDGKSRGTKHMIDLAKKYKRPCHVVSYQLEQQVPYIWSTPCL